VSSSGDVGAATGSISVMVLSDIELDFSHYNAESPAFAGLSRKG
jgi:hypothetical protein